MFPLAIAAAAAKLAKIATAATGPGQKKYTPDSKAPASGIYGCVDCMCLRSNYDDLQGGSQMLRFVVELVLDLFRTPQSALNRRIIHL